MAELEKMLSERAAAMNAALAGDAGALPTSFPSGGLEMGAAPILPEQPLDAGLPPIGEEPLTGDEMGMLSPDISPELLKTVSSQLVEAGLMTKIADSMTPDFIAALQGIVDSAFPGLYDLNDPMQLFEVVNGIASGDIPIFGTGAEEPGPLGGLPPEPGGLGSEPGIGSEFGAGLGPAGFAGPPPVLGLGGAGGF